MTLKVRTETDADCDTITRINDLAFCRKQEGELVLNLRKRPEFDQRLSLVADAGREIVGHILFFPVVINSGSGINSTLSLGPMSVLPEYQKKGIGGALIINGLKKAQKLGFKSVVVLGHPQYYPKFGFSRASAWKITAPFEAPDEAMMAMELVPGSLDFGGGEISYPPEFFDAI